MIRSAVMFAALLATSSAFGAVVEVDTEFGPGTGTYDPVTGLEWLDLPASASMSYLEMASELQPGGIYEDWRYATPDEVAELFFGSGGVPSFNPRTAEIVALGELLGFTVTVGQPGDAFYRRSLSGMYDLPAGLGYQLGGLGVDLDAGLNTTQEWAAPLDGSAVEDLADSVFGHWLVREGCVDQDDDGVCDADDLCLGMDASGDGDADGICNDLDFTLITSSVIAGSTLTLRTTNGPPNVPVRFWLTPSGLGDGPCLPSGQCGVLNAPIMLGQVTADVDGTAEFSVAVPSSARAGRVVGLQAAAFNGIDGDLTQPVILRVSVP